VSTLVVWNDYGWINCRVHSRIRHVKDQTALLPWCKSLLLGIYRRGSLSLHCQTLMGSRANICCTIVLLAYPFLCIGTATVIGAIGKPGVSDLGNKVDCHQRLLITAAQSHNQLLKVGSILALVAPISMLLFFAWTQLPWGRCTMYTIPGDESSVDINPSGSDGSGDSV
jgi:hypothetical protein